MAASSARRRMVDVLKRQLQGTLPGAANEAARVSVISYNILADGESLALSAKHDYCPISLRQWPKREEMLIAELKNYSADIVCLQECSFSAFGRLQKGFGHSLSDAELANPDHWLSEAGTSEADQSRSASSLVSTTLAQAVASADAEAADAEAAAAAAVAEQARADEPLAGFHHSSHLSSGHLRQAARESARGLACFVRLSTWQPLRVHAEVLSNCVHVFHKGRLRETLHMQDEAVLMLLLRHRASGACVLVATTHLFWDPYRPEVKAAQAELVAEATTRFLIECDRPAAVVITGDFNSVPHLQPEFIGIDVSEEEMRENSLSAVYQLYSQGICPARHPEHPDRFKPKALPAIRSSSREKPQRAATAPLEDPDEHDAFKKRQQRKPMRRHISAETERRSRNFRRNFWKRRPWEKAFSIYREESYMGPLRIGLALRDAYADALSDGPLPATSHSDDFRGCLDYLWVSAGGGRKAKGRPFPPKQLAMLSRLALRAEVLQVLEMPYGTDARWLPRIPNAQWPSDHLAIGAVLSLPRAVADDAESDVNGRPAAEAAAEQQL